MRFKASIKNTNASIIMQLITMAIGLVLPRLYLSAYGSEINGLVSSITQFIAYFTLVEAGLASAIIAALFLPLAKKNETKINQILSAAKNFYFYIGYIFSGLVVGLALVYPFFVNAQDLSSIEIGFLVLVLGFQGSFDFFTLSRYRALLTADQKFYVVANASTIANVINFILVVITIKLSFGIIAVRIVALTSFILRSIILNIYVRHHYKYVDYSVPPDNKSLNKRWDAMILQLLGLAQTSMPIIMLTVFVNDLKVVSVYSIYNMVAISILSILTAITNGFSASFGDMIAKKEMDTLTRTFKQYEFLFFSLMIWLYSCMNILYIPFIRLYTSGITDINYIEPLTATLFVLNGVAYNLKTPAGTLIGPAGVFKETKLATIIQTFIAVGLSFILTPKWGINGILVALIISNVYRDIDLIIFMSKNVIGIPYCETFGHMIKCIIIFAISNLPFYFININSTGFMTWLIIAVLVTVWCLVVVIIFNLIFNRKILFSVLLSVKNQFKNLYRRK